MKKLFFVFALVTFLLTGCFAYQSLNLNRLTTGMTKSDVERVAGYPNRILAVNDTPEGFQEVLEYVTASGDYYALEFWDDYLIGYEYLNSDVPYVAAPAPPAYYPAYGRSVVVIPARVRPVSPNPPAVVINNNHYYNNQSTSRPSTSSSVRPSSTSSNRVTTSTPSTSTTNRTSTTRSSSSNTNRTSTQRSSSTSTGTRNSTATQSNRSSVTTQGSRTSTQRSSSGSTSTSTRSSESSTSTRSSGTRTR